MFRWRFCKTIQLYWKVVLALLFLNFTLLLYNMELTSEYSQQVKDTMQTTTMISLPSSKVHVSSSSGFALAAFVRDQCNALKKPYNFWDQFGRHSIQMFRKNDSRLCYHDATFSEFVQFVVWSVGHLKNIDPHFLPATEMCVPCTMDYSFIGKMESFSDDIYPVLEKIQLDTAIPVLKEDLKELSNLDALQDSIFSPYGWKLEILQCMSWYEALRRVWRKLQMRGLIDLDHKFPLDKKAAEKLSKENFLEIAKRAWKESDVNKLKKQKIDVFIEMYRSVPINVLKKFVTAYNIDFHLYNYDPSPQEIFIRTLSYTRHNFADFRN